MHRTPDSDPQIEAQLRVQLTAKGEALAKGWSRLRFRKRPCRCLWGAISIYQRPPPFAVG